MNYTVLLIALPLLLAFLSMFVKKGKENLLYIGVLVNVLLLFVAEQGEYFIGGFKAPYGISLVLDQYSYIGIVLINTIFLFAVLANYKQITKYSTVILTLLAGVNGMLLTGDLFNLFVFMEITTISLYILNTSTKSYVTTFNYIIIGAISSGIYLLGVIMLYSNFGSLNLAAITEQASGLNALPLLLIFTGLSVEAKLFPLNGWVKGIFKNANGLVGSLMAAVVAAVSLLVMGRIINGLMMSDFISNMILVVAVITLIAGELSAYNSKSIKEILLYSSIGQSGLVTILMVSGLIFPALLVIINNSVSKMIMFTIGHTLTPNNEEFTTVKGIFSTNKLIGLSFTVASFSLIGLPLFFGFYAKLNSLMALININMLVVAVILFITIIEGAYLIRLNIALWHPGQEGELTTESTAEKIIAPNLIIATVILSALIIAVGLIPNILGDSMLDQTILDDQTEYITDLKGGM